MIQNDEATADERFIALAKLVKCYVMPDWLRGRDEIVKEQKKLPTTSQLSFYQVRCYRPIFESRHL
jgi:hypothetical protein